MSSNLKVLQVIPKLGYGGAETGCYDIAHYLPENNCGSFLITSGGELIKFIDEMNWNLSGYQKLLLKINRLIGWGIGILMSIIPERLCFNFHQAGELKAAKGYSKLKSSIDQYNNFESISSTKIKNILDKIIESEKLHSATFKALLAK